MAVEYRVGDMFRSRVEARVNPVNTVGVMGKGLALEFKQRFLMNFLVYESACERGEVCIGKMLVTHLHGPPYPHSIINFPTKKHWRDPSKIEWIVSGLIDLVRVLKEEEIRSVAVPQLGCGNGGLSWWEVKKEIERALDPLDIPVWVYVRPNPLST